jgi:polysaccharide export outer membrane protein
MTNRGRIIAALTVVLLMAACTISFANAVEVAGSPASSEAAAKTDAAAADDKFIIGPEDTLQITVWKEAELSGQVPVRSDGKISMALLNDVQAAGLTPMQLANSLTEKLKKFISDPQVSVVVRQINSRKYFLLGQVKKPGSYPLGTDMTVLQALSSAGGFNDFAAVTKIYVLRQENGQAVKHPFNYKRVIKGEGLEQNQLLKPNDTIVVP